MAPRSYLFVGVASLFVGPSVAQFGVVNDKKRGTGFEDLQNEAKNQMAGFEVDALGDLSKMDPSKMQEYISEAMKNPEMMDMLGNMGAGMEQALEDLAKMTPDEMAAQMKEAMDLIGGDDYLEEAMKDPDTLIQTLEASGMVTAEQLEEFKSNPEKLKEEMKEAMSQLKSLFNDPETIASASEIAKSLTSIMSDPEKMQEAVKGYATQLENDLGDDDKIEEARLQLLADPSLAGGAEMAALFQGEEMQAILKDPEKWKAAVQQGKGMLMDGLESNEE
jgi:uncharacterized protein (UPF0335 family)